MKELIDRKETIKAFCLQDCGCDPKDCMDKTCYEVEIIESVPTVGASLQWIPCANELPKVGDSYLVTGKQKWSNQKEWEYFTDVAIYEPVGAYIDDCWTTWNDWIEGQETHITAWAKMPEPYKGE